jgi:DNA processing protein
VRIRKKGDLKRPPFFQLRVEEETRVYEEKGYVLWLSRVPGIGPVRLKRIRERYGSAKRAWEFAEMSELLQIPGIPPAVARALIESRNRFSIEGEIERLRKMDVHFCIPEDPDYPTPLLSLYDPPPVLYLKGNWLPQDEQALAIVGSRRTTPYGQWVTRKLTSELVQCGVTIVSGLARGIDSFAHEAALQANGRTLAVLAGGFMRIYPRENTRLAQRISENGALISEYPPETQAVAGQFPARNRIISGLVKGVVVIEAGKKSGALITADQALEQGRDVFAVPGPITSPASLGTNELIKQGAKMVTSVEDILEEYKSWLDHKKKANTPAGAGKNHPVLDLIGHEGVHVDDLYRQLNMSLPELHKLLLQLEISGAIRALPGGFYARADH